MSKLSVLAKDYYKELHQIPEAGFRECKTRKYISSIFNNYKKIEQIYDGKYGLIYCYKGHDNSEYDLGIRAEMDAVEIDQVTKEYYHGCGHDAHMSILMTTMNAVENGDLAKNLLFIFQCSEEKNGGAKGICDFFINQEIIIEHIIALHVTPDLYPGYISINSGEIMAQGRTYNISFSTKGGHISVSKSNLIQYLCDIQEFCTSKSTPVVHCNLGAIISNGSHNVTPNKLSLTVTFRSANTLLLIKIVEEFFQKLDTLVTEEVLYESTCLMDYPMLENGQRYTSEIETLLKNKNEQKVIKMPFIYSCDDFAFYSKILGIECCYFFIGAYRNDKNSAHTKEFKVPDTTLVYGVKALISILYS